MIWHIFRKDCLLLWRVIVGVALLHFAQIAVLVKMGHFNSTRGLNNLVQVLFLTGMVGSAFLITAVVHQDSIPGVRQDWLVRPIKRRDLLLAKMLFVLAAVAGPILTANLTEGLPDSFPFVATFGAALSRTTYLTLAAVLPMLAFAAITKNFMEMIVGGAATFFAFAVLMLFNGDAPGLRQMVSNSSIYWIGDSSAVLLIILFAAGILVIQFFRRKTMIGRVLAGAALLAAVSTTFLPWQTAFALQQRLSPSPGASSPVALDFDASLGRLRAVPTYGSTDSARLVAFPLRVGGLADGSILAVDHTAIRLAEADGRTSDLERTGVSSLWTDNGDPESLYATIPVPATLLERIGTRPIHVEIEESLTLFGRTASYQILPTGANQQLPDLGWCKTRANDVGTAIQVRCLKPGRGPACTSVFLEHGPSGHQNPKVSSCGRDYAPFFSQFVPDSLTRFSVNLPFSDPSGRMKYLVDGPQIPESHVVARVYQRQEHFTRHIVIPSVVLKDWLQQ